MPAAYDLHDIRLVQQRFYTSAADAELLDSAVVPPDKIWTVIAVGYYPSVNETQVVMVTKVTSTGRVVSIMNPISVALQPMLFGLDQGLEVQMFPGENLRLRRANHTAGSTMNFTMQYIETDVPLYDYVEPQIAARIRRATVSSVAGAARSGIIGARAAGGMFRGRGGRAAKSEAKRG